MAREDVQKKWEERIAAFRSSGEKAARWCKANQVDRRGLYTWMKRLSGSSPAAVKSATFVKAHITPEPEATPSACLRIRIGAAVIEVDAGFNPTLLRDVVQALEVIC
ncbi:IS66 family insertion sequence element accessory protein TnpA [Cohnella algarum]|uniref:IS66 family insertion sequence element accessory protein TnpA n=1 Tax=Cohnella algarum TaxID=2044859 RepID=UPI0019688775|nr:hypothetical protein [Cohnella algarum]MBN2982663.1 hypothetical protein [Cohnella algarum]